MVHLAPAASTSFLFLTKFLQTMTEQLAVACAETVFSSVLASLPGALGVVSRTVLLLGPEGNRLDVAARRGEGQGPRHGDTGTAPIDAPRLLECPDAPGSAVFQQYC
ncbi:hypothetical protein [Deinococcus humi]|uniref:Uncharacterized protein n=1 Tax=Deinococcus humi TaxID=662880 RepID=A0A7W8JTG3_9DEIO|nr:hypothetical protein [Deinococcus humi]MBB5362901.1 hypothetical protein [Deinococcus humi]GGO25762.1 hypothetical protein GCM10008949_15810 [Deinococcus humi]